MKRALVAACAAALLLPASGRAERPPVRIQSSVSPGPHLFGDRVEVELDVLVDDDRADVDKVQVDTSFDPYERIGPVRRDRESEGTDTRLSYRYTLECLFSDCQSKLGTRELRVDLPPATVRYRTRKGARQALSVTWPRFRLVSRYVPDTIGSGEDIKARLAFQNDLIVKLFASTKPPSPTYRLSPALLGALLLTAALAVALAAGALTRPLIASWRANRARPDDDGMTPVERALERVERAARHGAGTTEHREALARLARELRPTGPRELVNGARRLAWSEETPSFDDSTTLTQRVRKAIA